MGKARNGVTRIDPEHTLEKQLKATINNIIGELDFLAGCDWSSDEEEDEIKAESTEDLINRRLKSAYIHCRHVKRAAYCRGQESVTYTTLVDNVGEELVDELARDLVEKAKLESAVWKLMYFCCNGAGQGELQKLPQAKSEAAEQWSKLLATAMWAVRSTPAPASTAAPATRPAVLFAAASTPRTNKFTNLAHASTRCADTTDAQPKESHAGPLQMYAVDSAVKEKGTGCGGCCCIQ